MSRLSANELFVDGAIMFGYGDGVQYFHRMLESLIKDFSPSPLNSSPGAGEELWRKAILVEEGLLGLIFNKSQNKFQDPSMKHQRDVVVEIA